MAVIAARVSLQPRDDTDPSSPSRQDMIVALGIPAFIVLCIGAALIHFARRWARRGGKPGTGQSQGSMLNFLRDENYHLGHPSDKHPGSEADHLQAKPGVQLLTEPGWEMVVGGSGGTPSVSDGLSPNERTPIPLPAPSPPDFSEHSSTHQHAPPSEISPPPSAIVRPRSSLGTNYSYYNWTGGASDTEEATPDHATETFRSRASRASDPFSNRSTALDHDQLDCVSESGTMSTLPPSYRTQRPTTTTYHRGHALPPPISSLDVNIASPPPSAFIIRRRISGMFGPRPNVRSSLGQVEPSTSQSSTPDALSPAADVIQDTSPACNCRRPSPQEAKRSPRRKSIDGGISLAGGPAQELPPSYNGRRKAKPSESQKGRTVRRVMT
ncbi:hypothetical protein GY45DRAFT_1327645 [Cubamyces sp. BRFM 1775]|nr:hypothetical protein GY45DRAFT_1327645 [Cubamyces sp. BRFM 1775]